MDEREEDTEGSPEPSQSTLTNLMPSSEIVDLVLMTAAVEETYSLLLQAKERMEGYLSTLTPSERKELLNPPHQLNEAGRSMLKASKSHPVLLAACPKVDADVVINRLDRVLLLSALAEQSESITQMVDDTRRKLLSNSYEDLLSMYRIGKPMSTEDPDLQVVIKPFAEIYAARKRAPKDSA